MISILALALATTAQPNATAAFATIAQPNLTEPQNGNVAPMRLSMDDAVEVGTERSFRLQRSVRNERMAEQRVAGTRAGLLPRVDVGMGADQSQRHYDFKGDFDYNQARPAFYAAGNANASYDIDISGVKKRQLQQSRLSKEMSEVDLRQATLDVSSDIRTQYVQALRAQEQVAADEDYLRSIEGLLERARTSQPSVVSFLETERSNAKQSLESTKQNADLAFSNLRQGLRIKNDQPLELTSKLSNPVPLPSADQLLNIAYQNRNDLKQADIRLKQARLQKVQATDSRKPSLRASANASQAFNGDYITLRGKNHGRTQQAAALLNFALPIFLYDGGQLNSQKNIANIQAEQALADAEEARERAENEINQVMIGLNRAQQRLKSLPDANQARQSLLQAEQQMLVASPTEAAGVLAQVTNARQNWRSSLLSRNDALTDFYSNFYRLQRSLGTEDIGPQYVAMAR
ncbi:MAG TPA: TolC family protein [Sphingomicrobium sp.]|nr:TolC family protein [Sphingomicrobium sp.]HVM37787.1 TolC family protein [Sphingomicrobium sp.]